MKIMYQGKVIATINGAPSISDGVQIAQSALNQSISHTDIDLIPENARELKKVIRGYIADKAGDSNSLLGTTTDGMQLLLHAFSQLNVALSSASSLAEVRAAAEPFNELATGFLAKVEAGEVSLPFQIKGVENVVSDIENRATQVAEILKSNQA
ncbi:hypothetical protein [Marinomonas mediterranea]|jgi:hypothetical protein|uniref:Uncharacterized protein n=1 Tax=Marinomonas mediterranea (strain ATCC 700492 / JCM 21426 / NBRC 103028 / MMB-1) TaxID=717774 RepID=F2K1R1_MARM1|nr:hypothetical protein [Marinomonas mediterranea]ADZ93395.1 hypothetical protein Marme_4196 [Marinomonas mediterranea MMB-1]WCN11283.1 hypothetical protein GV055_21285 [Marinomonas mediterranea]WCN15348.1 hypothetical protein GV054_21215 [Marinomonas mediterranea]WCN19389.1 hypothetical protein GV053_21245 [Marinomonas mediterranea MMB-1]